MRLRRTMGVPPTAWLMSSIAPCIMSGCPRSDGCEHPATPLPVTAEGMKARRVVLRASRHVLDRYGLAAQPANLGAYPRPQVDPGPLALSPASTPPPPPPPPPHPVH